MMFVNTIKNFSPPLYLASVVAWVIYLVVLDLCEGATTKERAAPRPHEESEVIEIVESGCLKIDDIKICE